MRSISVIPVPRDQALSARECVALCILAAASLVVALASLPGASSIRSTPAAIVFPPWISGQEAVARSIAAGHLVLRSGRSAFIVIVAADAQGAPAHRPDGAVLVLTLAGLAGCLDAPGTDVTA